MSVLLRVTYNYTFSHHTWDTPYPSRLVPLYFQAGFFASSSRLFHFLVSFPLFLCLGSCPFRDLVIQYVLLSFQTCFFASPSVLFFSWGVSLSALSFLYFFYRTVSWFLCLVSLFLYLDCRFSVHALIIFRPFSCFFRLISLGSSVWSPVISKLISLPLWLVDLSFLISRLTVLSLFFYPSWFLCFLMHLWPIKFLRFCSFCFSFLCIILFMLVQNGG